VYFIYHERKKKEGKQMTAGDNPTTINRHSSLCVEEDMIAHPGKQQKTKFGHQVASHTPPEWRRRHPLVGM
jgi:hypothetical protein